MISSQNLVITGGEFVSVQEYGAVERALAILYKRSTPGALHNSGERFNPPRCHPNTRVAIIDEIMSWCADPDSKDFVLWMNGPAGAGKSAICQAIAELCFSRRRLSGSFFFNRTSTTGRNSAAGLVATLAYQVLTEIPEARLIIAEAIAKNPLIFDLSWETQLVALIVEPLADIAKGASQILPPRLFIIDGLDECIDEPAQSHVVRIFVDALGRMQHSLPHKILFASRPESHLISTFGLRSIVAHLRRIRLDDSWKPDDDIRTFLVDSFAEIKQEHPLGSLLKGDWPPPSDINHLVGRSSGQFIYASTVIRYIKFHRHHPVERLKVILGLVKDPKHQAFAELDALYRHILSSTADPDILLRILCIVLLKLEDIFTPLLQPLNAARHLLGLPEGMVELHLNALSSVIEITQKDDGNTTVNFLHASLLDFLTEEGRAGPFYLYSDAISLSLVRPFLDVHSNTNVKFDDRWRISLHGPRELEQHIINDELRDEFFSAISEFDWKAFLDYASPNDPLTHTALCSFVNWIVDTSGELISAGKGHLLSPAMLQIARWVLLQMQDFPFNGLDNKRGVDLTVIATSNLSFRDNYPGSINFHHYLRVFRATDLRIEISKLMTIAWELLHVLPMKDLADPDVFGLYALTGRRYADAAVWCLKYLASPFGDSGPLNVDTAVSRLTVQAYEETDYYHIVDITAFFLDLASPHEDLHKVCIDFFQKAHAGVQSELEQALFESGWLYDERRSSLLFELTTSLVQTMKDNFYPRVPLADEQIYYVGIAKGLATKMLDYALVKCKDLPIIVEGDTKLLLKTSVFRKRQVNHDADLHHWSRSSTTMRWYSWLEVNALRWIESR